MQVEFDLRLAPSTNTYWRNFRGRMLLSKPAREFKSYVASLIKEQNIPSFGDQMLKMELTFHPRDKRKTDVDSRAKATLDALEGHLYENDHQITELLLKRDDPIKGGWMRIKIQTLD